MPDDSDALPAWIYELADGDEWLLDALSDAWVARSHAQVAVRERGDVPSLACREEMRDAETLLASIRVGHVPKKELAQRAVQSAHKFDVARQLARFG
jgi:hypothetical protein